MKLARRRLLSAATGAAALHAMSRVARAQSYPTRPIRLILTTAAGGSPDIIARLIGQWLSERLGQPIVVENRTGAGSNIGTEIALRAPPDGYTQFRPTPSTRPSLRISLSISSATSRRWQASPASPW